MEGAIYIITIFVVIIAVSIWGVNKNRERPPQKYFIVYVEDLADNNPLTMNDIIDIHPFRWQMDNAVIRSNGINNGAARTLVYYRKISE